MRHSTAILWRVRASCLDHDQVSAACLAPRSGAAKLRAGLSAWDCEAERRRREEEPAGAQNESATRPSSARHPAGIAVGTSPRTPAPTVRRCRIRICHAACSGARFGPRPERLAQFGQRQAEPMQRSVATSIWRFHRLRCSATSPSTIRISQSVAMIFPMTWPRQRARSDIARIDRGLFTDSLGNRPASGQCSSHRSSRGIGKASILESRNASSLKASRTSRYGPATGSPDPARADDRRGSSPGSEAHRPGGPQGRCRDPPGGSDRGAS